ncbi:DNA polymerase IV [Cytobacillus sp. IB215665]|uniref:DNA polymerase IV n=1 Tax=Cytobacillus sp. IB215665 TaxID=3097357 RepID=UPI002A131499|nr:DNA polymerase IV [Cytobacillus sp. IB215665]MDX8364330.1 DNA polymerase IV [Cytobacillus sp. IB215665]
MKHLYPKNGQVILHVDMNSFYASVEVSYEPSLKGKPIAIAGNVEERRGIIITCSYEARALGVKTTMPVWEAKKLCPTLSIIKPNFERYRKASLQMFDVLRTITPLVEPVSIDEGYVDITNCYELGSPLQIATEIQKKLLHNLQLPCSIGIAPNKFLAKMASNMRKPLGITILRKRDVATKLWPLQVDAMHGVGKRTAEKLKTINIQTIEHLAKGNDVQLRNLLGINGIKLKERANGQDGRQVDPEAIYDRKSIGNSTTLPHDTIDERKIEKVLQKLALSVGQRLRRKHLVCQTVQLTIRYANRKTITRSQKLSNPMSNDEMLFSTGLQLLKSHWDEQPIRLLGITAQNLLEKESASKQLDIFSFEDDAREEPLANTITQINEKFGKDTIKRGVKVNKSNDYGDNESGTSFEKDFFL